MKHFNSIDLSKIILRDLRISGAMTGKTTWNTTAVYL